MELLDWGVIYDESTYFEFPNQYAGKHMKNIIQSIQEQFIYYYFYLKSLEKTKKKHKFLLLNSFSG